MISLLYAVQSLSDGNDVHLKLLKRYNIDEYNKFMDLGVIFNTRDSAVTGLTSIIEFQRLLMILDLTKQE